MSVIAETLATSCNVLANVVVLHTACRDPTSPMPRTALALQVCANVSWVLYAVITRNAYLGTTASTSLTLLLSALVVRSHGRRNTITHLEPSADELQQFSPS